MSVNGKSLIRVVICLKSDFMEILKIEQPYEACFIPFGYLVRKGINLWHTTAVVTT